ncbi:unnamed protein product, partial [Candidula unifasciata]
MSLLEVQLSVLNVTGNTSLEELYDIYDGSVVLVILYAPIFLVAVVGNLVVLLAVLTDRRMRKSSANYFLVNLAIADLLVALMCIPMTTVYYMYNLWLLGTTICKATGYLQGVSIVANVFTIVLMSVDRYFAIRLPLKHRQVFTVSRVRRLILMAWVSAAVIVMPVALVNQVVRQEFGLHSVHCTEIWPSHVMRQIYDVAMLVCIYVLPGTAIVVLYTLMGCRLWARDSHLQRQVYDVLVARRRLALMMIIISMMFAFCWLPYNIFNICLDFELDAAGQLITIYPFTILLGHSNSAQNPVLYWFMHRGFKAFVLKFIKCQCRSFWFRQ